MAQAFIKGKAYFDGSGDYLSVPNTSDFNFGSGDFCIEATVTPSNVTGERTILALYGYSSNRRSYNMSIRDGQLECRYSINGVLGVGPAGGSISSGNEYHLAFVRYGNTFKSYINGTLVVTLTPTSSALYNNTVDALLIGAIGPNLTGYFNGETTGVRITKGSARYTANFTPPTYFENDTNTVLCMNFGEIIGATTFIDDTGKTVTTVGNVVIVA